MNDGGVRDEHDSTLTIHPAPCVSSSDLLAYMLKCKENSRL